MSRSVWKIRLSTIVTNTNKGLKNDFKSSAFKAKSLKIFWKDLQGGEQKNTLSDTFLPEKQSEKKLIYSRGCIILPQHINLEFLIYNGKNWRPIKVTQEMVGHKFGEFSSTRKKTVHKLDKKKQKSVKKMFS